MENFFQASDRQDNPSLETEFSGCPPYSVAMSVRTSHSRPKGNGDSLEEGTVSNLQASHSESDENESGDSFSHSLAREQQLRQIILSMLTEGVLILNADGKILEANSVVSKLTQMSVAQLIGANFHAVFQFCHVNTPTRISHPLHEAIAHTAQFQSGQRMFLVTQNGTEVAVKVKAVTIPETLDIVVTFQDVSRIYTLSQQLQWQAEHDPITGLVNRMQFEVMIAQALEKTKHEQRSYVLAQLDLDNFKLINDTCGTIAGDQVLGQLAIELQDHIRAEDVLARLGGDEFGILFDRCSLEEAHHLARELQTHVEQFRYPWQGKSLNVAMSVGLVPLDEETDDVEIALSKADTACYAAKNRGKSRIQVFSSRDVAIEDLKRHQEWNFLIQEAIEESRFSLYRQPIVGLDRLEAFPHHYEVLLRMVGSSGDIIAPNRFIPTAERYQLMPIIDRWVIQQCVSYLEAIAVEDSGQSSKDWVNYAINLSGTSLSDDDFLADLVELITQMKISPKTLCFEITETAAIANLQQVHDFMKALHEMGCRFALDDFGAGMSSFGYLSSLPVDFVKIDGKFIQNLESNRSNITIVQSMVQISKSLGLMTVAERVERESTAIQLKAIGVDFVQGFGVGRPTRWI